MTVKYQSRLFSTDQIAKRYAACGTDLKSGQRVFLIFDVDAAGYTIRETVVDRADLPADVVTKCEERAGFWPNQVPLLTDEQLKVIHAT